VRARPTLRLGLLLLALCAGSVRSLADDAAPHALIAVFETARNSLPQGPLPNGLRFVLYDDGQILTRAGPSEADPDPAGRGVVYGMIGRGAAENLRREAAADLQTITRPVSGLAAAGEVGSTILDVWDGLRYRRFGASAWPCRMEGRVFAGGWQRNRADTDPQFLKVCDRLLQYKIASPPCLVAEVGEADARRHGESAGAASALAEGMAARADRPEAQGRDRVLRAGERRARDFLAWTEHRALE
jgi:hypothetical protein